MPFIVTSNRGCNPIIEGDVEKMTRTHIEKKGQIRLSDGGGGTLFYMTHSPPSTSPETNSEIHDILFVHGTGLDHRMWNPQVTFFTTKGYSCITPDLRGFGKSLPFPTAPYSYATDLKLLLDHLEVDKVHIVGLSRGGRVVLELALAYPDYVASVTSIDGIIDGFQWDDFLPEYQRIWDIGGDPLAAKERWKNGDLFKPLRENEDASPWKLVEQMLQDYSGLHFVKKDPVTPVIPPTAENIRNIRCPALILVGEKDYRDFHRMARLMHESIPNSEHAVVPNAGHMASLENPHFVNTRLEAFLEKRKDD